VSAVEPALSGHPAAPPAAARTLPAPAALLLIAFGIAILAAWAVTILTANNLMTLLGGEIAGAAPIDHLAFFSLAAVMMAAMMLPSTIPMVSVYRSLAIVDTGRLEGNLRATLFSGSYLLVWGGFGAVALVLLMEFGLMGPFTGYFALAPGLVLVAAGVYQFTRWKRYCLEKCQSPLGFFLSRWKGGRKGAMRLGLDHAGFCLGCCWLLMLVVFVTGAMSLLWMGVFSGLVLVEKVWGSVGWFTRGMGLTAMSVGAGAVLFGAGLLPL
jgi:predicted metal-binding membrane protein